MNNILSNGIPIVDGHLDLAENVTIFGRDITKNISQIRKEEDRTSNQITVTLPELKKGNIALTFATITAGFLSVDVGEDFKPSSAIYHNYKEAEAQAMSQIELYEEWEKKKLVRIVKSVNDLDDHLELWKNDRITGVILLMEGADPIVEVKDLPKWWKRGLRMIGITFGDTQYGAGVAGGSTKERMDGLNKKGMHLIETMAEQGFIWDVSHLTEKGMRQGFNIDFPRVCASHANAQKFLPTNRHLSNEYIKEIARRGGVIGLVLYNGFLDANWKNDRTINISLNRQFKQHVEHVANLVGWKHVGIGSDLDGGFGCNESPEEIDTIADLYKIGEVVPKEYQEDILSNNWLNFLRRSLPK